MPETSIVIRTFNEEKYLPGFLEAVEGQEYRDFEIVVVDSGSFDRTREIAGEHCDKLLRISSEDFTFGYSLNVGVGASEGRFVAMVSAHTKPLDSSWLGSLVAPLGGDRTAMTYGRQVGWETSKFGDIQDLRRVFGPEARTLHPPNFFANNANSAVRRELWESHPFDETLPGLEDVEWAKYWMERGYQVVYEPSAGIYHIHEETWPQVRRRYYREAVAAKSIGMSGPSNVPAEVIREGGRFVADLYRVVREDDLFKRLPEIVLFRANKAIGTARGLLDGKVMASPDQRRAMFFDRGFRSVVISGRGRAALEETEAPRLKPGEVLVRVAYAGVSMADVELFEGVHGSLRDGAAAYPLVPGDEVSGWVVSAGTKVSGLSEGDPVVVGPARGCGECPECEGGRPARCTKRAEAGWTGAYAQYIAVAGRQVHRVPEDLDPKKAALARPLAVVMKGLGRLTRAWPASPDNKICAVVGVGPMGHLCARVLAHRGHLVTVFDRDPVRLAYFDGSGISKGQNLDELREFEVLVETTGDPEALQKMMAHSPPGALILLLGLPQAHQQFVFQDVVAYDKTVIGSVGSGPSDMAEAIEMLPRLELDALTGHVLPLDRFEQAWDGVRKRESLKTLLEVAG